MSGAAWSSLAILGVALAGCDACGRTPEVVLPGCEAAKAAYYEDCRKSADCDRPDLEEKPDAVFKETLDKSGYFDACKVPRTTRVELCVAIRSGAAEGITVTTTPHDGSLDTCIAARVRSTVFPVQRRMILTRTRAEPF